MSEPLKILKEIWGYPAFRPLQEDIVNAVLSGQDTLALLPTGGGKSICFQVPGMILPGLTLVISPLIALMQDQVENLNRRHIPATSINSSLGFQEIDRKLNLAMKGRYKFLYMAPERLMTDMFQARMEHMNISLVAIDEAHCISQWGYDFRPAYLDIHALREKLPQVPFIALTATAAPRVQEDILDKLQMQQPAVFRQSFRRDNLAYQVISSERVPDRILQFLQNNSGSGIIYARTRKRTIALADLLKRNAISAAAYHGGLPASARSQVQQAWLKNETRIITATNAFGMGIDKPDVRFVLHFNLPGDLESYYQEAGRAGRDGKPATALAFDNAPDMDELQRWVAQKYPAWEELKKHYEAVCNYYGLSNSGVPDTLYAIDLSDVAQKFGVHPLRFYNSLQILRNEGLLSLHERPDDYAYLRVSVPPRSILAYKARFPDHAALIDYALRSMGGEVYMTDLRFSPKAWAYDLNLEGPALAKLLDQLAARKIIRYRPPAGHPTLRFLKPRVQLTKLLLNWPRYEFLARQANHRLAVVERYIKTPATMCRSRMLERYFGEKRPDDCGICDYCKGKAAGILTPARFARIRASILASLGAGTHEIRGLLDSLEEGTSAQRLEVFRAMLDKGELQRTGGLKVRKP
ncbi:MAG TPA: RecQ family ATP-dependent DNA helicase [Bacteroidetes bacterium]|nr:RecQ family ATP-dependent DNA helicase [Bacteroidota bacterium]